MNSIRRMVTNPYLLFTASRYFSYAVQFLRGMLVAKVLGPYFFGIWGFLTLVQQYLSYTNLGLQFAVLVELTTESAEDVRQKERAVSVALILTLGTAAVLLLLGLGVQLLGVNLFEKFEFSQYVMLVVAYAGLANLQHVLTSIYRVYKKLLQIAVSELLNAVILLVVVFLFKDAALVWALLGSMIVAALVSISLYLVRIPFKVRLEFDFSVAKHLLKVGLPLLVYNVSYYLIVVAARTVLAAYYSVEEMGYYSLANSLTTATLLGLQSAAWLVMPDVFSRTHQGVKDEDALKTVSKVNGLYSTAVFLVVFSVILLMPALFLYLPQFEPAGQTITVLLLAQGVLSVSFGYNALAIARRKQNSVAMISLLAVLIVVSGSLTVAWLKLSFEWIAFTVLLGALVYTLLQSCLGARLVEQENGKRNYVADVLPLGSLLALGCFLAGYLFKIPLIAGIIGMLIYCITNWGRLYAVWSFAKGKLTHER